MCRWLAFSGAPLLLSDALYSPINSMIDQSLHSKLGAEATNGDGFGIGWYDDQPTPGLFKSIEPAWNDQNLRELAGHVHSGHFFAHLRAAIGSPVQQTNCHPFRHERWLFMHNGFLAELPKVKRELMFAVDPSLYPEIEGTADTELLFYLALTFGLTDDPQQAISKVIGLVEDVGARAEFSIRSRGRSRRPTDERTWAFRYSSEGKSRSLFYTRDVDTLRALHPDAAIVWKVSEDARLIVSEPIGDMPGAWVEVPESTCSLIAAGQDEVVPFRPTPPTISVAV